MDTCYACWDVAAAVILVLRLREKRGLMSGFCGENKKSMSETSKATYDIAGDWVSCVHCGTCDGCHQSEDVEKLHLYDDGLMSLAKTRKQLVRVSEKKMTTRFY